jgi:protein-L-isoaspartate(D-aspartate) O-methyltransferase
MDFVAERLRLVLRLKSEGLITTPEVERAMLSVPRENFVWPGTEAHAYIDAPLPLSDTGQTISAPHMVAIMLEELDLKPGMSVLEIGTGSGYNAALLAELVGSEGKVVSLEINAKLVDFAMSNLEKTGYGKRVQIIHSDGSHGYPPGQVNIYDRICVTAAAPEVPKALLEQLRPGGILLIPIGSSYNQRLVKMVKNEEGKFERESLGWVSFVPLRMG